MTESIRRLGTRRLQLFMASGIALMALLISSAPFALGQDQIIINGNSCQVTEEDAVLHFGRFRQNLYLRVDFPDSDSHWRFGLRNDGLKGLSIVDVSIQAAQFTSKQYMIKHAGLADIFVPYDDGTFDPYDMHYSYNSMDPIESADLPSYLSSLVFLRSLEPDFLLCGFFHLCYVGDAIPKVGVECRETGLAWLCKQSRNIRRRMHEVVVWGVYDGGNYDNIIEYRFREDGSIGFRYGATGYVNPGKTAAPHVHNGLWRVSTKLFDRTDNNALEFVHVNNPGGASSTDSELPIPTETSLLWEPLKFSTVMIQSATKQNKHQNPMGYEFIPWNRTGTGRFSQNPADKQLWTLNDYYLTNDNPGEDGSGTGTNNWRYTWYSPDDYLLSYLNGQGIGATGDGIVVWYISSVHHEPTDSDSAEDTLDLDYAPYTGVTPIHWSGFDMDPHNLFDYNPLGGPPRCGN
jgi:Cu2+-containing amine oxidase